MRAPDFWWRSDGLASTALAPLAAIYGAIAGARLNTSGIRARVPVICIGDPTVGGAGKTPAAIAIAKLLTAENEQPFIVTRGYGGRYKGPLLVNAVQHSADDVGDEPLLLSRVAPTIVSADRVAGAEFAADSGASVVVLDDGFQNPALEKDFSFLVIDGTSAIGNGRVFPAGPLRAPLLAQINRAQAMIVIETDTAGKRVAEIARTKGVAIVYAHIKPERDAANALTGKRVLAYAGIGRPTKFLQTLQEIRADVVEWYAFPDHHVYSPAEARDLLTHAKQQHLLLVTTEKDHARLLRNPALAELAAASQALPIELQFDDVKPLKGLIKQALQRRRS